VSPRKKEEVPNVGGNAQSPRALLNRWDLRVGKKNDSTHIKKNGGRRLPRERKGGDHGYKIGWSENSLSTSRKIQKKKKQGDKTRRGIKKDQNEKRGNVKTKPNSFIRHNELRSNGYFFWAGGKKGRGKGGKSLHAFSSLTI